MPGTIWLERLIVALMSNVGEISKAILALKSMPEEERRRLGENGKKFVLSNHTYQVLGKRFFDIMNNLIKK